MLGPAVDEVYAAGRTLGGGRTRPAPEKLVQRLAELLVGPLRERALASLDAVVREGPYDGAAEWQRVITGAIGARYREFRAQDLDLALGDMLVWAFARGIYDATPDGTRHAVGPRGDRAVPGRRRQRARTHREGSPVPDRPGVRARAPGALPLLGRRLTDG